MIKRSSKDQGQEALIIINPNLNFRTINRIVRVIVLRVVNKILLDFCLLMCPVNQMNQPVSLPDQDAALQAFRSSPNTLDWEEDMQMSSNFLDRKVTHNIYIYIYMFVCLFFIIFALILHILFYLGISF